MTDHDPEPVTRAQRYLDAVERVSVALSGVKPVEDVFDRVLDEMLDIFDCDRAFVLHPLDPDAETFRIEFERTRPEWPGAGAGASVPHEESSRAAARAWLETGDDVFVDVEGDPGLAQLGVKSMMAVALRPATSQSPWLLGIHHCEVRREYDWERPLLRTLGRLLTDALSSMILRRALEASEERFRLLVDHSPDAIVLFDPADARFVHVNARAERLFGLSREELLERGPADVSPERQPDGRSSVDGAMAVVGAALEGQAPVFEWTHQHADGTPIACEVRLVEMPFEGRRVVRGSITDIGERKRQSEEQERLREQLVQAQKMEAIGQLTGGVAHDFNNLLAVILTSCELAMEELGSEHPVAELIGGSIAAARQGADLTSQLLAFSRQQALKPRVLDANGLLAKLEPMLRRTLGEHIEVELVRAGGLWRCEVDPSQLESVMLNLAINARDAMPDGGKLTLETANARLDHAYASQHDEVAEGQYVQLSVTDSGVGMAPEVIAQAFEPFFSTKAPGRGTGLGLSMVFGFVKQSGGHVKIYSELGEGTTVKIYLPRSHAPESVTLFRETSTSRGSGERILVVEDQQAVRKTVVRLLTQLGYRAVPVADAEEALEVLRGDDEIALLFTDVMLPGGTNGAELAHEARELRPSLRVLFTSGYTPNAIVHNGRLDPGVELVEKPYTVSHLSDAIARALDGE